MNVGIPGRIAVIVMLLGVAVYVGLLLLLVEPTPWRDLPEEGMSRNGVAFDRSIAELRIYRMPARRYPLYFEDELAPVEPLLRAADPALVARLLATLQPPPAGAPVPCEAAKPESGLHVVTYRPDGTVYGYVVVFEANALAEAGDGAAGAGGCSAVLAAGEGGQSTWFVHGFAALLEDLGIPL